MISRASTTRRAVAATILGALVALVALPARADHLAPGGVEFVGAYATDGIISAADAALPEQQRVVDWQDPAPGTSLSAEGRFTDGAGTTIAGGTCGPFTLGLTGNPAVPDGYLNQSCMNAAPQGTIQWRVKWWDGATFTAESIDSLVVDTLASVTLLTPAANSLNKRVVNVSGTADPGSTVKVLEGTLQLASVTSPASGPSAGTWAASISFATGTHTIKATALDAGGNSATTATLTFDADADAPVVSITSPTDSGTSPNIILPGENFIIEGTARDTNGNAFGGIKAVEVNIYSTLTPDIRIPSTIPANPVDLLGVVRVGKVIAQDNAPCTPAGPVQSGKATCNATGVQQATWTYDATYLPTGIYSIQVQGYDKAANAMSQPATILLVVKL
jgi:hypothetical protein